MSRRLLKLLNGNNKGAFRQWLDKQQEDQGDDWEPRIAWYPAANLDFSPLVFLAKIFSEQNQKYGLPEPPQIFLFTDIGPDLSRLRDGKLHELPDQKCAEEYQPGRLGNLSRFKNSRAVCGPSASEFNYDGACPVFEYVRPPQNWTVDGVGDVWFLSLRVYINGKNEFEQPLIYVIAENAFFCSRVLLQKQIEAQITHIYYRAAGAPAPWLGYVLRRLKTEVVFTDEPLIRLQEHFFCNQEPQDERVILRGDPEDIPDIDQWNDFGNGWYTKKKLQQG